MEYGMMLVFLLFALVFVGGGIAFNYVLMPYKPTEQKRMTYECGLDPIGDSEIRYNLRFYVFALLYVVFAVEAAFLLPWAVVYRQLPGWAPLLEVVMFIFILILGLAYAWRKGELTWD